MSHYLVIALVALLGLLTGWIFHTRTKKSLLKNLRLLALEKDGIIKQGLFTLPKLHYKYDGKEVEISSASTGSSAESEQYTYVLINGIDFKGFEFRLIPKSIQTVIDTAFNIHKQIPTGYAEFDDYFSVYSNSRDKMLKILNDKVRSDLLDWAEKKSVNSINDIRNYDDKLIFSISGEP
ncbi:MAG: hypothetical protein GTN99_07890, partial [Candidatus Dadabacteria bacterium]|nr:hypothetical protein [Candidatus Dadabacteria bacterium]